MKRRILSQTDRTRILAEQGDRCRYCWLPITSTPAFDHVEPYSLRGNQRTENFVAACGTCNNLKASFVFDDADTAAVYIREQRRRRGLPLGEPGRQEPIETRCEHCGDLIARPVFGQRFCTRRCGERANSASRRRNAGHLKTSGIVLLGSAENAYTVNVERRFLPKATENGYLEGVSAKTLESGGMAYALILRGTLEPAPR